MDIQGSRTKKRCGIYPGYNIYCVKRGCSGTFAVYKNLLKATGDTGAAEYSNYGKCCDILLDLEQVVQDMLIETCENSPCGNFMLQAEDIVHIDKLPIRMLGFSKGVVIVNQVLLELSRAGREQNKFGDSVNPSTIRWSGGVSSGIMTVHIVPSDALIQKQVLNSDSD